MKGWVQNMEKKINKKLLAGILAIIVIVMAFSFVQTEETMKQGNEKYVVAIDPGHGGFDPGKVGVSGALEKDINLSISWKVKQQLEKKGIEVIMTRTTDQGLYAEEDKNKKSADMRNRVETIQASGAAVAVSIHQNSFTDTVSKGSQVFYYTGSKEGQHLANLIQTSIKETLKDDNHRTEKGNTDYYMLRKVTCPIVIVECGFLSNPMEEALLTEEDYQEKMANGISKGIIKYLTEE